MILKFTKCMLENESINERLFYNLVKINFINEIINNDFSSSNILMIIRIFRAYALLCDEHLLNVFTPFLELNVNLINFGDDLIQRQKAKTNLDEDPPILLLEATKFTDKHIKKIRLEALYLLSILLRSSQHCHTCLTNHAETNILKTITRPTCDSFTYSYDCIYHIVSRGLYPDIFKTLLYYNLTANAIQSSKETQLSHVISAINISYPYDWSGLWENDIVSYIFDLLRYSCFEVKELALYSLLTFCDVSRSERHIRSLLEDCLLEHSLPLLCSLSKRTIMLFISVYIYIRDLSPEFQNMLLRCDPAAHLQPLLVCDDSDLRTRAAAALA